MSMATKDTVLATLHASPRPMSSNEIGQALGLYDGERWRYPGYQKVTQALLALRDDGGAVKLPHEGERNGAVYAECTDHAHATSMQLAATEKELVLIEASDQYRLRGRLLRQALIGLRAMNGDTEGPPESVCGHIDWSTCPVCCPPSQANGGQDGD